MWQKLGQFVLNFIVGKLAEAIATWWKKRQRHKEIDREAEKSTKPLKDAKTAEEIDHATDDALNGL